MHETRSYVLPNIVSLLKSLKWFMKVSSMTVRKAWTPLDQYTLETGVVRAATMTNLVFGSDYSKLKAKDILSSFENDARLITLAMQELFETPIIKLAARYGLVSSNCQSLLVALLVANSSFCLRLFAQPPLGILYHRGACIWIIKLFKTCSTNSPRPIF